MRPDQENLKKFEQAVLNSDLEAVEQSIEGVTSKAVAEALIMTVTNLQINPDKMAQENLAIVKFLCDYKGSNQLSSKDISNTLKLVLSDLGEFKNPHLLTLISSLMNIDQITSEHVHEALIDRYSNSLHGGPGLLKATEHYLGLGTKAPDSKKVSQLLEVASRSANHQNVTAYLASLTTDNKASDEKIKDLLYSKVNDFTMSPNNFGLAELIKPLINEKLWPDVVKEVRDMLTNSISRHQIDINNTPAFKELRDFVTKSSPKNSSSARLR